MPTVPASFPARLRSLRERAGLTVADLAERSGLYRTAVWKLEAGQSAPTWDTVCRLADALGVGVEVFRRAAK